MPHKHTSSLPELEDVGLISPNQQTQFVRRIDILSLKQKRVAFISFLISSFIVVLVFLVGPPYLKTSSFVNFGDPKLTIQNFNINITNLNFFFRFLVLDVTFLKEKGYCLGMPVKKYRGENKDVVHPLNTEFRNKLTNAVIEKLKEGDKNEK